MHLQRYQRFAVCYVVFMRHPGVKVTSQKITATTVGCQKNSLHRLVKIALTNIFYRFSPLSIQNSMVAMGHADPKANTLDFKNHVLCCNLKCSNAFTTPM